MEIDGQTVPEPPARKATSIDAWTRKIYAVAVLIVVVMAAITLLYVGQLHNQSNTTNAILQHQQAGQDFQICKTRADVLRDSVLTDLFAAAGDRNEAGFNQAVEKLKIIRTAELNCAAKYAKAAP